MIDVIIPSQLRSYTGGAVRVRAAGATIDAALDDLNRQFPGIKFRVIDEQGQIRPHMRLFANGAIARNIGAPIAEGSELFIAGALSGG